MKEKICVETKKAPKKVYRTENETKFEMYMSMYVCVCVLEMATAQHSVETLFNSANWNK